MKNYSNMNSQEFPMLTKFSQCTKSRAEKSGKMFFVPNTEISRGTPDFFKISNVSVKNSKDVFTGNMHNFHYTDVGNRERVFDMNVLKPSQSLDIFLFKRHDVKLKAPFFDAYKFHLSKRGFARTSGAFTQIANCSRTTRTDEDLKLRELNMTRRYQKIADSNRPALSTNSRKRFSVIN